MSADNQTIHRQGKFCGELANRLSKDIAEFTNSDNDHHCQIQDDIKRLRRELMTLSKMFGWGYKS